MQIDCDNTTKTLNSENYSLPLLPREIVEEEILPRLPVKSLLRFKCVSKSWRSSIESQWFVEKQYQNSRGNTSLTHHRVMYEWTYTETRQCSLQWMLDQTSEHPSPFDEETDNKPVTGDAYVVGCCNGLLCFVKFSMRYFFLNPATKKFFKLPKLPAADMPNMRKSGFCWDETAGAYKVFALLFDTDLDDRVARVYSSKTNSWTTVEHGSLSLFDPAGVGVHACGYLHWIAKKDDDHPCHIESFDLRSETFGKIEMPFGEVDGFFWLRLGEVRGCIGVMREDHWYKDLWVMKEHGVEESWEKLVRIGDSSFGLRLFSAPCGERVLACGRNFLVFSGGNETAKRKKISHGNGAGAVKSKKISQGWFSSVKDLFRGFYKDLFPFFHGIDFCNNRMYFYVESLVSPFPPPL